MSNFDVLKDIICKYFEDYGETIEHPVSSLHDMSYDKTHNMHIYNSQTELDVINMDLIAKYGYRKVKNVENINNVVSTVDAFLIDQEDNWIFVEFKNSEIKNDSTNLKRSVLKKAYSNWYMLLDILYDMSQKGYEYPGFTYDQPIEFARRHIKYILVCSNDNNKLISGKIHEHSRMMENYTPDFMQRLKDYLFLDAYVYTEIEFEREFVKSFHY